MHKDFADWYRLAGLEPNPELLPKRWAGIEEYGAGPNDIVGLTRLFHNLGSPDEKFLEEFRAPFKQADVTFPMRGNDQELCVLAGAELADTIDRGDKDIATLAALSLVCASAQNLRKSPCVPDIPEIATKYINGRTTDRMLPSADGEVDGPTKEVLAGFTALGGRMLRSRENFVNSKARWTSYPKKSTCCGGFSPSTVATNTKDGVISASARQR